MYWFMFCPLQLLSRRVTITFICSFTFATALQMRYNVTRRQRGRYRARQQLDVVRSERKRARH